MECVVLSERCRQLGWVSEDLGPGLNGCNVLIHVLTRVKGLRDL